MIAAANINKSVLGNFLDISMNLIIVIPKSFKSV